MNPITFRPTLRFSGILPIHQVFDETRKRALDVSDRNEDELAIVAVGQMEKLVKNHFPYSRFKAPAHPDVVGQQALINDASAFRRKVLDRLKLIDPDFANDPHQRLAALSSKADFVLLTGEDAQPILDADQLQDSVLDKVGTDAMHKRTKAEVDADAQAMNEADAIYAREEGRIKEYLTRSARGIILHIIALPGAHTFWGRVGANMLGVPAITITNITVS